MLFVCTRVLIQSLKALGVLSACCTQREGCTFWARLGWKGGSGLETVSQPVWPASLRPAPACCCLPSVQSPLNAPTAPIYPSWKLSHSKEAQHLNSIFGVLFKVFLSPHGWLVFWYFTAQTVSALFSNQKLQVLWNWLNLVGEVRRPKGGCLGGWVGGGEGGKGGLLV